MGVAVGHAIDAAEVDGSRAVAADPEPAGAAAVGEVRVDRAGVDVHVAGEGEVAVLQRADDAAAGRADVDDRLRGAAQVDRATVGHQDAVAAGRGEIAVDSNTPRWSSYCWSQSKCKWPRTLLLNVPSAHIDPLVVAANAAEPTRCNVAGTITVAVKFARLAADGGGRKRQRAVTSESPVYRGQWKNLGKARQTSGVTVPPFSQNRVLAMGNDLLETASGEPWLSRSPARPLKPRFRFRAKKPTHGREVATVMFPLPLCLTNLARLHSPCSSTCPYSPSVRASRSRLWQLFRAAVPEAV